MLKRYQVLLPDWLEEYIKSGVVHYNFSFSEIIRLQMCFSILSCIEKLNPEYKAQVSVKDILDVITLSSEGKKDKEDLKRFISLVYYETRKAIEYRTNKKEQCL